MPDSADTPANHSQQVISSNTVTDKKPHWFYLWGMPGLLVAGFFAGPLILQWLNPDPLFGQALVNLGSIGLGGLFLILLLFWFCVLSPFSRRTILMVTIPLLLISAGWAASIRMVKFNGDMVPTIVYRWDSQARLQQATESIEGDAREFVLRPGDVPAYRGVNRDGIVTGPPLNSDWQADPPRELWRTPVGGGYASMAVVDHCLLTIEQRENNEAITCYDARNGQLIWVYEYPSRFYEAMGGLGPRSTPTVDQGQVFAMGAEGTVTCLDFFTGKLLWKRNLLQELQLPNVAWGMSSSPLVLGEQVIVNPGSPEGNGLMSLNRVTGETIWKAPGLEAINNSSANVTNLAGYSSPVLMTVAGVEQIVIFDGHGLSGHDPSTGQQWWHYPYENDAGVNVAQPILLPDGNQIFISASYGMGSALLKIQLTEGQNWQVDSVWQNATTMRSKFSNPILHDGFIYGLDEGILMCIDPYSGEKKWKKGRYQHGQVLLSGGQLLIMSEDGDLVLVQASPEKHQELTRMTVLPDSRVWNPHVLSEGIVYVRDEQQMAAYDLREQSGSTE